jgi:transcriptional regulator with XRE-family HTH domain
MDLADVSKVSRELLAPVRDLGEYIREQRTAAQISLRALAAKAGVSNPYLSQVERGLRRPSAAILAQIADGLSISAESLLVKAGILRPTEATPVIAAIRADQHLSERQKSSLTEIYLALRAQSGEQHADRPDSGHTPPPAGDRPIPASPDEREAAPETEE